MLSDFGHRHNFHFFFFYLMCLSLECMGKKEGSRSPYSIKLTHRNPDAHKHAPCSAETGGHLASLVSLPTYCRRPVSLTNTLEEAVKVQSVVLTQKARSTLASKQVRRLGHFAFSSWNHSASISYIIKAFFPIRCSDLSTQLCVPGQKMVRWVK